MAGPRPRPASARHWKTSSATRAYGLAQLRQDLERFVFLLGGSDGEPLFGLPPPSTTRLPGQPTIRRALPASTSFVLALRAAGTPR